MLTASQPPHRLTAPASGAGVTGIFQPLFGGNSRWDAGGPRGEVPGDGWRCVYARLAVWVRGSSWDMLGHG